ncbi:MAG: acyl-ACP--UDP-N-acetylglucosamine O-acyltransferase [bacterium]|nr:acyl-ACP--UDP-N-acetylglucosamine O-acyltransferase [bacterium]
MPETLIHPTAAVAKTAALGTGVRIGPFAVVEDHVEIGDECILDAHAVIRPFVRMGARNRVYSNAVLGGEPQDVLFSGEPTGLEIGEENLFREASTVHRATNPERPTRVGSGCMLMVNVHIGHDCQLGDNIVLTNDTNLAGHVEVGDGVLMGGMAQVHQFVRVGRQAMVAGSTSLARDALPYAFMWGILARHYRLNTIGLRRSGIKGDRYRELQKAYRALCDGQPLDDLEATEEIEYLRRWLAAPSKRGLAGFAKRGEKEG